MKMFIFIQNSRCVFKQKSKPSLPFKFLRKFFVEGRGAGRSYVLPNSKHLGCALQLHGRQKINFDVFYTKGPTTNIESEPHISSSLFSLYTMEITCCLFFYRWRGKEEACIFILSLSQYNLLVKRTLRDITDTHVEDQLDFSNGFLYLGVVLHKLTHMFPMW